MTLLLDTNVLSEILRRDPNPAVLAWFAAQPPDDLHVGTVTQAEMLLGARLLPAGRRRAALEADLRDMFDEDFAGRLWPFDSAAATHYADIVASRRAAGRPVTQFDAQIAAIARCRGAAVATRNVADFEGCGVEVVNPWGAAGGA
jgi:hypothetical protein